MTISIGKVFRFEMAHILKECDAEECKNSIHGHSYVLEATISLPNGITIHRDKGMFLDLKTFGDWMKKEIISLVDHKCYVPETLLSKYEINVMHNKGSGTIYRCSFNPTAENLLVHLIAPAMQLNWHNIKPEQIPFDCNLRLWETASGFAELKGVLL